jgi:hypothetical protein
MAVLTNVSAETIILSAGVSVVTGYVGTLLQFRRQRDRMRRTYGLAILAEIKSLQRVFRQYHGVLGSEPVEVRAGRVARLPLTNADLNVFGFNSGNIGLFSVRTAVEVIELYSRTRALIAQAQAIAEAAKAEGPACPPLEEQLFEHLKSVVVVRRQSREVARLLISELPVMSDDVARAVRRWWRVRRR